MRRSLGGFESGGFDAEMVLKCSGTVAGPSGASRAEGSRLRDETQRRNNSPFTTALLLAGLLIGCTEEKSFSQPLQTRSPVAPPPSPDSPLFNLIDNAELPRR